MHARRAIALAAGLSALTVTVRASAWQEAHQTGGDIEVHVDPSGVLFVRDLLKWHVVRGPLHWIDLVNVDPTADVDPAVVVSGDDGRTLSARASRRENNVVRVDVDDAHAFLKGTFSFDVRWRFDALKSGVIARDGAAWRLAWTSPAATDGYEMARTTFDVPAARVAPFAIFADTGAVDPGALATLHREPASDVLELVRPHVARAESAAWTLRLDPGALGAVADPRVRPVPEARPAPEPDRVRDVSIATALLALALAFALLVAHKARAFAALCAARALRARSMVPPLPDGLRAAASGAALAAGVGLQGSGALTAGTALVATAMLLAALRPPVARQGARGPGRWLALRPEDAFAPAEPESREAAYLDASTPAGRLAAAILALLLVAVAFAVRRFDSRAPWLLALDAAALAPIFFTGRACDVAPDGARTAAPWLASVFAQLRGVASLRVAPWTRVLAGGSTADELRLLVLPRVVMPGVVGVEVGRAWSTTPVGWTSSPEVLVRVLDASSAAAKLALVVPGARTLPGRRPDERVLRLRPRRSTHAATVALTRRLAEALTDRRSAAPPPWTDVERRVVPLRSTAEASGSASATIARGSLAPTGVTAPPPAPPRASAVAASKAC
jgi:hypothetical protein